jgi:DNA-directed RNA polymerase specialized sigma24 family protein
MKYDPDSNSRAGQKFTETELLMMPFVYGDPEDYENNWEHVDSVNECIAQLSEEDQIIIKALFWERQTFEQLAKTIGVKAKSHAWLKAQQAVARLKEKMEEHETFRNWK